ncbi:MAG: hypothetical protein LAO55_23225 [Acidobacteriia bacterium]|nr:hypothetical protein [Terriglobia bacterium]
MKRSNHRLFTLCQLVVLVGFASLFGGAAWADQITLKNGDRLTGSLLKSDEKNLVLKSESAGTVTIP